MPVQLAGHDKPLVLSRSQRVFRDSILLFPQVLNRSAIAGETPKKGLTIAFATISPYVIESRVTTNAIS